MPFQQIWWSSGESYCECAELSPTLIAHHCSVNSGNSSVTTAVSWLSVVATPMQYYGNFHGGASRKS